MLADGGIKLDLPQCPGGSLLGAAIAIGIRTGFKHGGLGHLDQLFSAPTKTLSLFQDILSSLAMHYSSFYSWHLKNSFDWYFAGSVRGDVSSRFTDLIRYRYTDTFRYVTCNASNRLATYRE